MIEWVTIRFSPHRKHGLTIGIPIMVKWIGVGLCSHRKHSFAIRVLGMMIRCSHISDLDTEILKKLIRPFILNEIKVQMDPPEIERIQELAKEVLV